MKKLLINIFISVFSSALFLTGFFVTPFFFLKWLALTPLFGLIGRTQTTLLEASLCAILTGTITTAVSANWLTYYSLQMYFIACLLLSPTLLFYLVPLKYFFTLTMNATVRILGASLFTIFFLKAYEWTPFAALAFEKWFYGPLPLLQTDSIGGIPILAGIVAGLDVSIALQAGAWHPVPGTRLHGFFIRRHLDAPRSAWHWTTSFTILLLLIIAWGNARITNFKTTENRMNIALVQHNLPISGRWRLEHKNEVKNTYKRLAIEASKKHPNLIIFPLYTFPEDILKKPNFFTRLSHETGSHILAASHVHDETTPNGNSGTFFSAAILYSPAKKIEAVYRATEAPPFRNLPEQTSPQYRVLDTPMGKLGILLCYENTNPRLAREAVRQGAEILITLSNPGHFQNTTVPRDHLQQDQLRAIETERDVLRVSANGYTAHINKRGKVLQKTEVGKTTILYASVPGTDYMVTTVT